jgi:protocatechuate 3,4-dioxygenase alpha subunit
MAPPLHTLRETPSQTAGPYVHIGLTPNFVGISGIFPDDLGRSLVDARTLGERIRVTGRVFDGADEPIRDCVVEIWQADAAGLYPSPSETRGTADAHFSGWARCPAAPDTGAFTFDTIKPGRVPFPDGRLQAPHISVWIVARGINVGLHTRIYFSDEEGANSSDPILLRVEHQSRLKTLIAVRSGDTYAIDFRIQGQDETIFFDI